MIAAPEPSRPVAEPLGETTLLLRFGTRLDAAVNARVHHAAALLRVAALRGLSDIVPAYASLALHYDPGAWSRPSGAAWRQFADAVGAVLEAPAVAQPAPARTVTVPVCYGGAHGPDIDIVARHCGLSVQAVADRHAAGAYTVAMLGFAPGFPYLLGLDPALAVPRRSDPRLRVAAGSVAIGGVQTGIYPTGLPGGWHLIGRTPLRLFEVDGDPPCPLAAGDQVRFRPITAREFEAGADR